MQTIVRETGKGDSDIKTYTVQKEGYKKRVKNGSYEHKQFMITDSHLAIIAEKVFNAVVIFENGICRRKNIRYSSKGNQPIWKNQILK